MYANISQMAALLTSQSEPGSDAGGGLQMFGPLILMLFVFYFLWFRPAAKERKAHQKMLEALKRGDEIVTNSGIIGTIADTTDRTMTLEVARNVKIQMLKSAITKRTADLSSGQAQAKAPEESQASRTAKS